MDNCEKLSINLAKLERKISVRRAIRKYTAVPKGKLTSDRLGCGQLTVVLPCYNEADRLDVAAFRAFFVANLSVRMIFVNDGSKDCTLDVLIGMQAEMPDRVDVIDLMQNGGKAEAVRQGLLFAANRGDTQVAYWDADLATPLDALPDFTRIMARFADVEVVFGSRRMMLGHRIERTLKRRLISRACNALARLALRLPIADTQCGAKLFRNSPAFRAAIAAPFNAGWLFDVELFARIAEGGCDRHRAFYEMPLAAWSEIPGSKLSARAVVCSGLQMLVLIVRNRLHLGAARPVQPGSIAVRLDAGCLDPSKSDKAA